MTPWQWFLCGVKNKTKDRWSGVSIEVAVQRMLASSTTRREWSNESLSMGIIWQYWQSRDIWVRLVRSMAIRATWTRFSSSGPKFPRPVNMLNNPTGLKITKESSSRTSEKRSSLSYSGKLNRWRQPVLVITKSQKSQKRTRSLDTTKHTPNIE